MMLGKRRVLGGGYLLAQSLVELRRLAHLPWRLRARHDCPGPRTPLPSLDDVRGADHEALRHLPRGPLIAR